MVAGTFSSTAEIQIPKDPFDRVIGQDEAVKIAKLIPQQRRHLLLVGPPGSGKSLIAKAIASLLPKPEFEISVLQNKERPERPIIEIRDEKSTDSNPQQQFGKEISAQDVPVVVAERLGIRCKRCGMLLNRPGTACASCDSPPSLNTKTKIALIDEKTDEDIIYSITSAGQLIVQTESEMKEQVETNKLNKRKILLPFTRNTFIAASGATETELLGDVAHDPYGESGSAPYTRVIPGAIHEAHEGVLFIDELSTLGNLQKHLLSAMQEKTFPISGRNPTSSGASVRVDGVPCDFIFIGASNMADLANLHPALRSRINGDGYELLMNSTMPDIPENRKKIIQFIAQEIVKDGKIPHASNDSVELIITHSKKLAKEIDDQGKAYTLRLRLLSGIIKLAGDLAKVNKNELISNEDVRSAIENARSIEEKIEERYGSAWRAGAADYSKKSNKNNKDIR